MDESTSPTLDRIVSDIGESGELDLSGYPPEVIMVAIRESWQEFAPALQALNGLYTTLGLLLGELDERFSLDAGNPSS